MGWLAAVWEQVYGLVVEDGWIALGAIGALVATFLYTRLTAANEAQRDLGGLLLFAMIAALMLTNLYAAGRKAARK